MKNLTNGLNVAGTILIAVAFCSGWLSDGYTEGVAWIVGDITLSVFAGFFVVRSIRAWVADKPLVTRPSRSGGIIWIILGTYYTVQSLWPTATPDPFDWRRLLLGAALLLFGAAHLVPIDKPVEANLEGSDG